MAEKLVIELLEEVTEKVFDEELEQDNAELGDAGTVAVTRQFRWGFIDELSNWPADSHTGSEDDLLMSLSHQAQPALLLVPGDKVVSLPVAYNKKEARHFLKLLPYQIEDEVIGSVDELHFAVSSNKESEVVSVAYAQADWISSLLEWMSANNIQVESCIADYQSLHASDDNELLIWFDDGQVLGHRSNGLGFSVAQSFSQAFLKDLLQNQQDIAEPWTVRVYVDDAETQEIIESHIMPPVEYSVVIGPPPLSFTQTNQLNFCTGKFGKKLPLDAWWKEAKPVAILAAAAIAVFFIASFADIYLMKKQRAVYQEEMLSAFRTVVPRGAATDPVKRLKAMLGSASNVREPSQVVYLLSKVAPALDQLKINLTTLNYSNREQALRINIKADSFNGVEQFRQQLDQQGVNAELQSSSAVGEGFQARLKIALKKA
ncbi:MAG: type II secretion system protein GspL [Cellvibrionaceae bacterium]